MTQILGHNQISNKIDITDKKAQYDENIERRVNTMCNLSDLVEERGINIGRRDGIRAMIEVCHELGILRADTLSKVISKFSLSRDEAEELMELYW